MGEDSQHLYRHAGTEVLLGHPDEHTEQAARERWEIRTEIRAGGEDAEVLFE